MKSFCMAEVYVFGWLNCCCFSLRIISPSLKDPELGARLQKELVAWHWNHVAFSHDNAEFVVYVNGTKVIQKAASPPQNNNGKR